METSLHAVFNTPSVTIPLTLLLSLIDFYVLNSHWPDDPPSALGTKASETPLGAKRRASYFVAVVGLAHFILSLIPQLKEGTATSPTRVIHAVADAAYWASPATINWEALQDGNPTGAFGAGQCFALTQLVSRQRDVPPLGASALPAGR